MAHGFWLFVGIVLVFALSLVGSALKTQFEYLAWKWSLKRGRNKQWWE